jgi:serine protease Do
LPGFSPQIVGFVPGLKQVNDRFTIDPMNRKIVISGILVALTAAQASAERPEDAQAEHARRQARRRTPVVEVVEKTRNTVVNISATTAVVSRQPFGFDSLFDDIFEAPRRATSAGSGFIVHPSGYMVTNAHVVARSTDNKVTFADEPEHQAHPARIVTIDLKHDLAVLKIDTSKPLPFLRLGRSDDLMIGETVIAIGNPLGYHHTVTAGVIGATNRTLEFSRDIRYEGLIQIDAAINPGNSGGPLLNINGELIGINTAIRGDAQNIGFAIPVDHLRRLLPEMMGTEIESHRRISMGLSVSDKDAVRVTSVTQGGPADQAGLRAGDRLLTVDGRAVSQAMDFYAVILDRKAGDRVPLGVLRDGQSHTFTLHLKTMPKPPAARLAWERLGLRLEEMTEAQARRLGLPRAIGILITQVDTGSPADLAGIRRNDVLYQLGQYYGFRTLDDVGQLLKNVTTGDEIQIGWLRSEPQYVYLYGNRLRAR